MDWRTTTDALLEYPIVTSFTRVGSAVRSRLFDWEDPEPGALEGSVALVTGPTSGLGREVATTLHRLGATVVLVARTASKLEALAAELDAVAPGRTVPVVADLGDLDAVREACGRISDRVDRLDVVVHNAGALTDDRRTAPDGTELTVASQVLGPFLMTAQLLPLLSASAPARVITVSSGGMYTQPLVVGALEMGEDDYKGSVAYARAKRAQVTLNEMWAERCADSGVVFAAMHPGWADTPGVAESLPTFRRIVGPLLRRPDEGADTIVWLATADEVLDHSGAFWHDRRPRSIHLLPSTRRSDTPDRRRRLWDWCEERTGTTVEAADD